MTANLSAMNLLLATRNQHKTREFTQLLGPNFTLRDLTRARDLPEIRETGRAFEENAVIKAIAISKIFPHEMVIADDSGLEVDALNGAPGIFSARYGGENASDQRNVEKLLREIQGATKRLARFRCVIALAKNGKLMTTVAGEVGGNGGVIQHGITDALLHHGIHGQPTVGIHSDHGDAAPGNMAAARFVWVIRPRRVKHERLRISHCRYPCLPGWPNGSGGLFRF